MPSEARTLPGGCVILLSAGVVGEAGQQRDECLRVGGSRARYGVPSESGGVAVGAGLDVVKCFVVAGAAGDAVVSSCHFVDPFCCAASWSIFSALDLAIGRYVS
jgi:hypothetical protein